MQINTYTKKRLKMKIKKQILYYTPTHTHTHYTNCITIENKMSF